MSRPWSFDQLLRVLGWNCVGAVLVAIGWYESSIASGTDVTRRLTWLSLAMTGLALSGISNAVWMLRGRRLVALARAAAAADLGDAVRGGASPAPVARRAAAFVIVRRSTRYHQADCPLVMMKPAEEGSRSVLEGRGLLPCEVCRP